MPPPGSAGSTAAGSSSVVAGLNGGSGGGGGGVGHHGHGHGHGMVGAGGGGNGGGAVTNGPVAAPAPPAGMHNSPMQRQHQIQNNHHQQVQNLYRAHLLSKPAN